MGRLTEGVGAQAVPLVLYFVLYYTCIQLYSKCPKSVAGAAVCLRGLKKHTLSNWHWHCQKLHGVSSASASQLRKSRGTSSLRRPVMLPGESLGQTRTSHWHSSRIRNARPGRRTLHSGLPVMFSSVEGSRREPRRHASMGTPPKRLLYKQ